MQQPEFLPMTRAELDRLGWSELDILLVTGDAYVDHPSFGVALLGRHLVSQGFRVGIIAQPDWKDPDSVRALGRPRLYAGATAGAMDSMVANYTANKKLRRDDAYAPGGRHGLRPNRATILYTNLLRHAFPALPIVLGGIEASLRRLAHYDYWDDGLRRSILLDAKADLLVFGMGERAAAEIARRLDQGRDLSGIAGTAVVTGHLPPEGNYRRLPSYEQIQTDPDRLIEAALAEEAERDPGQGSALAQGHGPRWVLVQPPAAPLTTPELDLLYSLPFTRRAHPAYAEPVPALEPVANSVVTHRGCFGGCSFCALGAHQGKLISSRSTGSIVAEVKRLTQLPSFHGTVTDLGGPTANMFALECRKPGGPCRRPSCLYPEVCRHLETSADPQFELWKKVAAVPGVKHVFVASGIRYDLALKDKRYLRELVRGGHVSGTLKVAPEHTDPKVLALMRKPRAETFARFLDAYRAECAEADLPDSVTAYFIANFPGGDAKSMRAAADFSRRQRLRVEPMQDFIPLPMTLAGIMYFLKKDPWTGAPLKITSAYSERQEQRRIVLGQTQNQRKTPIQKHPKISQH